MKILFDYRDRVDKWSTLSLAHVVLKLDSSLPAMAFQPRIYEQFFNEHKSNSVETISIPHQFSCYCSLNTVLGMQQA